MKPRSIWLLAAVALVLCACSPVTPRYSTTPNPVPATPGLAPDNATLLRIMVPIHGGDWQKVASFCDEEIVVSMTMQDYPQEKEYEERFGAQYTVWSDTIQAADLPGFQPEFLKQFSEAVDVFWDFPDPRFEYVEHETLRELPSIGSGILGRAASNERYRIGLKPIERGRKTTWLITSLELGYH